MREKVNDKKEYDERRMKKKIHTQKNNYHFAELEQQQQQQ